MSRPCATLPGNKTASVNQAIVNYIHKQGRCSFAELLDIFGPVDAGERAQKTFRNRLQELVRQGDITRHGRIGRGSCRADLHYTPPPGWQNPSSPAPLRTPSASYDAMHAPVYVPPPSPALRAGSLDYQRYASHGACC